MCIAICPMRARPLFSRKQPKEEGRPGKTGARIPMEHIVEQPKLLLICAMIILAIAGCLSLISPKQHNPTTNEICAALRAAPPESMKSQDNPRSRLLCADSGGVR